MSLTIAPRIYTIGHSTRTSESFVELLRAWEVQLVADVRTVPRSSRNPQFNSDALRDSLAMAGIGYEWWRDLGGWRKTAEGSPNDGWTNESFRGYADYAMTDAFASAMARLLKSVEFRVTAIMCAEAVPWRCHRRIIADALVLRGLDVRDITSERNAAPHRLTPFARVVGRTITYPAP
jgi:uncharacterized protein (DUF488 family)